MSEKAAIEEPRTGVISDPVLIARCGLSCLGHWLIGRAYAADCEPWELVNEAIRRLEKIEAGRPVKAGAGGKE